VSTSSSCILPCGTDIHSSGQTRSRPPDYELDLARVILDLGGDPAVRDGRFNTRPLDWARYFNEPELVDLLEPLTVDPAPSE
jgi:hypothetical protein